MITVSKKQPKQYWFTLPVPPPTNNRKGFGKHGYFGVQKIYKDYQARIRQEMSLERIRPFEGEVGVSLHWYRKRKQGDVMERFKDLWDALQAKDNNGHGPYLDDKQIADYRVVRDDSDPHNSRIVVHITPL